MGDKDWDKEVPLPECPTCHTDLFVERLDDDHNLIRADLCVCGKCGSSFVHDEEAGNDATIPQPPNDPVGGPQHGPIPGIAGGDTSDLSTVPAPVFGTVVRESE